MQIMALPPQAPQRSEERPRNSPPAESEQAAADPARGEPRPVISNRAQRPNVAREDDNVPGTGFAAHLELATQTPVPVAQPIETAVPVLLAASPLEIPIPTDATAVAEPALLTVPISATTPAIGGLSLAPVRSPLAEALASAQRLPVAEVNTTTPLPTDLPESAVAEMTRGPAATMVPAALPTSLLTSGARLPRSDTSAATVLAAPKSGTSPAASTATATSTASLPLDPTLTEEPAALIAPMDAVAPAISTGQANTQTSTEAMIAAAPAAPTAQSGIATTAATNASAPSHSDGATALDLALARQVKNQVVTQAADGAREMTLRLTPPELGTVRVQITEQAGTLHIRLSAEDDGVRAALERALPSLRQDLRGSELGVADVQVADRHASSFSGFAQGRQDRGGEPGGGSSQPRAGTASGAATPTSRSELGGLVHGDRIDARA